MKITEDPKSDISTIYAYLNVPEHRPVGMDIKCHMFSLFDHEYLYGQERMFIEELDAGRPGLYSHYHISWSHCN